ncbi:MAG: exonuclease SbcCD subunit D [Candidatus Aenigmarchaeota archaeon]|nr:exonuclease SbcCD subunit D [Candidatus Aenigmarchaeota archaeon]
MKFVHFSDTHLGFRQYGIYERETDFYRAFENAVRKIIEERPDFVLHTGDLFDVPKPPPRALWVAQRCFAKLREKGIPVYAITGNHDMLFRRGSLPPQVLFRDMGVRLLTEEDPFVMHSDLFIGGVPYYPKHQDSMLKEQLKIVSQKAGKKKSILMMHQGTDRHLKNGYEISMDDIPNNFSYYAMGHIHARITENFGLGKLVYPGSADLWSANEIDDYKRRGKGFTLVDMHGDEPSVQNVDIPLEREILREKADSGSLEKFTEELLGRLSQLSRKPMLYLDVKEGSLEKSAVHDILQEKLSGAVLTLRMNYSAETVKGLKVERSFSPNQIDDIIDEILGKNEKSRLASAIFRMLSEGNTEAAIEESEKFLSRLGGNK